MKTTNQILLLILIVWALMLSKKNCFFQLKADLCWRWRKLPKIYECDPIELEFVGKKNVIIPFKYINISNVNHTVDSFYLKLERSSSWRLLERDCMCYIWFHRWHVLLLESLQVRVSKICLSQQKNYPTNIYQK